MLKSIHLEFLVQSSSNQTFIVRRILYMRFSSDLVKLWSRSSTWYEVVQNFVRTNWIVNGCSPITSKKISFSSSIIVEHTTVKVTITFVFCIMQICWAHSKAWSAVFSWNPQIFSYACEYWYFEIINANKLLYPNYIDIGSFFSVAGITYVGVTYFLLCHNKHPHLRQLSYSSIC